MNTFNIEMLLGWFFAFVALTLLFIDCQTLDRLERQNAALRDAMKNIAMLTANGDAERANWVALGILNDPRAAIDAARKEEQP